MTARVRIIVHSLLIIAVLGLATPLTGVAQESRISPDWTLENANGQAVHLNDLTTERPTILFFWATWCPYCKALMPHLQSIRLEYGDDVNIVAMTIRDDEGDPVGYIKENGFDFTLLVETDEVAEQNDIYGTPGVLLLAPNREVVFNLYDLPRPEYPTDIDDSGNRQKAAYRGPYWAAHIRRALDLLIANSYAD
jgi:thiol-disulfide isomerase/thioredoxin